MLRLPTNKKQTMLNGAITLVITTLIVKVIGVLYKIPLTAMLGEVGLGYFSSAYDVYTPIVSISMAGIPIAVAKMVSQDVALHRYRNARQTYRVSFRLFIIIGIVGTAVMLLLAYPYAFWISKSPNTFYSILAISPAVFFCCAMSIYRGYYEGLSNMVPTGVSQVIEALGKLVLGLLLSYGVIRAGKAQFASGGVVFGKAVQNMDEAMAEIYPYAAAAAVMGVTIGTMIGFFYLFLRYKVKGDGFTRTDLVNSPKPLSGQEIAKMMIALAIPVVASSLITNVTNIIDAGMLRARLASIMNDPAAAGIMKSMYAESLLGTGTPDDSVTDYLYGCYSAAINFKNLVPMITMNFGVSALPVLSAAWATKDHKTSRVTIESVLRLTLLIGLPAGIQSAVFAVANIIIQSAINSLGTEVMAASSAAMSLEYVCYNLLNSFSQACTTFVGQNHGARQIDRCTKTLKVCLVEGGIVALTTIIVIVGLGREILSLFNSDPNIVSIGYIRVCSIFPAYAFSMFYENMSGYLRGFGISLTPALITMICVCGIRFYWVFCVFPHFRTFANIMMVYPISLGTTAFFMVVAVLLCHPARTYRATQAKATAR